MELFRLDGKFKSGKFKKIVYAYECLACFSLFRRSKYLHNKTLCKSCVSAINGKKSHIKHGNSYDRIYFIWQTMKQRCLDKNVSNYDNYGGRGITICDDWMDFISFKYWSLKNGYSEELTIDRVDNDKGYSPDNCRWADMSTQAANQKINKSNTSGYIGVSRSNGKFKSVVCWKRKYYRLGVFEGPEEAAKIRDQFVIDKGWPHTLNFNRDNYRQAAQ